MRGSIRQSACASLGPRLSKPTATAFPRRQSRRKPTTIADATSFKLRLLQPCKTSHASDKALLLYLPGMDGTGQAITTQVPSLVEAGYDVRCLYIPAQDRSNWEQLTNKTIYLLTRALADRPYIDGLPQRATIVAESFGGVLGLRLAAAAPDLVDRMILVNPATSFNDSLGGLAAVVSATNLLSVFPEQLYNVAQAVLLPLLVDTDRVAAGGTETLRAMISMTPPPDTMINSPTIPSQPGATEPPPLTIVTPPANVSPPEMYAPAAAANYRCGMLRDGPLPDSLLATIAAPTLVVTSAKDRMLPSLSEGARLQRVMPNAKRLILPDSSHTALLERDVRLVSLMRRVGFLPAPASKPAQTSNPPPSPGTQRAESSSNGTLPPGPQTNTPTPPSTAISSPPSASEQLPPTSASPPCTPTTSAVQASSSNPSTLTSDTANPLPSTTDSSSTESAPQSQNGTTGAESAGPSGQPALNFGVTDDSFDEWAQLLAAYRDLVSPVVVGAEALPDAGATAAAGQAVLFVGNHQKMGLYDTPLLVYELYMRGFKVRGLAHPGHWAGPMGQFFERFGAVRATPKAAYQLLKDGNNVLLFPGGAREVTKKVGEEYRLFWRDTPDFVRMASKMGAIIVPFAAVGADDAYDVALEVDDVLAHPVLGPAVRRILENLGPGLDPRESILPLTRLPGIGLPAPVPVPNLQRLYFKFCPPINTQLPQYRGGRRGEQAELLYQEVRHSVEGGIEELLALRAADGESKVSARLQKGLEKWFPAFNIANSPQAVDGVGSSSS